MRARLRHRVGCTGRAAFQARRRRLVAATKPATPALLAGALSDPARSEPALVAEHAFLRQQVVVLTWGVRRPRCTPTDRAPLVLLLAVE